MDNGMLKNHIKGNFIRQNDVSYIRAAKLEMEK